MFKSSVFIARINHELSVKFNVVIESDLHNLSLFNRRRSKQEVDPLYTIGGNYYYNITPSSYITLDFQENGKKDNSYNPLRSINLNKMQTFLLNREIKKSIAKLYKLEKSDTPVFWYSKDQLLMDEKIGESINVFCEYQQKVIRIKYTILSKDTPTGPVRIPGCILYSGDNISEYCFMTLEELEYLYHVLSSIDFTTISLQLVNLSNTKRRELQLNSEDSKPLEIKSVTNEIKDSFQESDSSVYVPPYPPEESPLKDL